ncbi:hypothetical protein GPECTOR_56g368 [Gonium pectorale]|uniref:OTU domain-containing protein n=1 Tax=Gonium pectorale TaxID=33097 RepID=A0A150G5Z5_GONPE|nr:hypothetical protein GPECTOR_56g368 [Gonium pectorale]|eukprot:KXZ45272.1 hypothetical protein GPECTOR_56g368 [Gonium pectorale]
MGRKGMKSFLKGVHKQHGSDDEAPAPSEAPAEQPSTTSQSKPAASQQPAAAPAQPPKAAAKADDGSDEESGDEEGGAKGPETRGKLLQRHKRELTAHKKAVQKLGSKKKDEAAKLTAELEARHARELKELDEREAAAAAAAQEATAAGPSGSDVAAAAAAGAAAEQLSGIALGAGADHKKPSKAQKRREKHAQQEAEREQRIAEEQAALGPSDKALEEDRLRELLAPLRLGIREIRADGHCLYRAVEDQLSQQAGASSPHDHLALRRLAAAHIRSHADDFLPFIFDEDSEGGPQEQLEAYCAELEGTAAWGGQLELGALAQVLKRQIKVYACGMPPVTLGDEHAAAGVLQLCYLRHAFGLGEHYNSVQPLQGAGAAEAEAEAGVDAAEAGAA